MNLYELAELALQNLSIYDMRIYIFRLINGGVTFYLSSLLFKIYKKTGRRFYYFWSLGYLFYGFNICIRLFMPSDIQFISSVDIIVGFVAFTLVMSGFTLMITGIGELIEKTRLMLVSMLFLPVVPVFQVLTGYIYDSISIVVILLPYVFMTISLVVISWRYKIDLKLLIIGWVIILLGNIGLFTQFIDQGFVDLLSAFGKIVIFWGMTQNSFSFLVEDLRGFITSDKAMKDKDVWLGFNGGLTLVNSLGVEKDIETGWIKERLTRNSRKGVKTIFLTLYDLITPSKFIDGRIGEEFYWIRMLQGGGVRHEGFREGVMEIKDDLKQLDLLFSDIMTFINSGSHSCEIILYSLSHLIHMHGWKRVYSFISAKISLFKENNINLVCFYFPESHENSANIVVFETLADKIIDF